MTEQERVARARRTQEILEDPVMLEALQAVDATYWTEWRSSPVRDQDAREKIYQRLKALDDVLGHLKTFLEDGKLAQQQIDKAASGKRSFY